MRRHLALMLLGALLLGAVSPRAVALDHVHVQIGYAESWDLYVYDFKVGRLPPATTRLPVPAAARTRIPDDSNFTTFLGAAGGRVWILPQSSRPGIISMGIGTSRIVPHVFQRNELVLSLHRVEGPGHFAMFTTDGLGVPTLLMSTHNGVDPATDFVRVPAISGHLHMNWAFTEPGLYRLGLAASGRLNSNGQLTQSEVVEYVFEVFPLGPRLGLRSESGKLTVRAVAENGWICRLESSDRVSGPWVAEGDPFTGNESGTLLEIHPNSKQGFFRLVTHPAPTTGPGQGQVTRSSKGGV